MSEDNGIVRVAVISDIHAYSPLRFKGKPAPSRLPMRSGRPHPTEDAFAGLQRLIATEKLRADILLCAGDMTSQADPDGLAYSWNELQSIGTHLGASLTTATPGNHDLGSRGGTNDDESLEEARDHLLNLHPRFPLSDERLTDRFWSKNYVLFRHADVLLCLLNSCPLHTVANEKEFNRGAITIQTLQSLEDELSTTAPAHTNILVCHHHPHSHAELRLGEADVMKHGQLLLDALESHGDWLVIHGHKHHPKITYAAGGGRSPIVFGAGSFGGDFSREASSICKNQFYILDTPRRRGTPGTRGKIHAWNWAYGVGWVPSLDTLGAIPGFCGFGGRRHPERLAEEISARVSGHSTVAWSNLCASIVDLAFLIPRDYALLKQVLLRRHDLRVVENSGTPAEVGRSHAKS